MTCPICGQELTESTDEGLRHHGCDRCGGRFIEADDHRVWVAESWPGPEAGRTPRIEADETWELAQDHDPAKACPADGRILRKHAVGAMLDFRLDRCATCLGVWLDPGEWAALGRVGLWRDLTRMFEADWQAELQEAMEGEQREALLVARFGVGDLARLRQTRAWLDASEQRSAMLAFLGARPDSR